MKNDSEVLTYEDILKAVKELEKRYNVKKIFFTKVGKEPKKRCWRIARWRRNVGNVVKYGIVKLKKVNVSVMHVFVENVGDIQEKNQ